MAESSNKLSMQQMLESGVHFGHQTRYWHPKMKQYIFGARNNVHIINLDKTLPLMQDAINFISKVASKRGKILFVGTKPSAQETIRAEAERCNMPYVSYRWLGGMLTNYKTIRQSIKRLKDLENLRESPNFSGLTKKETLMLQREIDKLEKNLGGIRHMGGLPEAIFVIDIGHEDIAIKEARKLKIPVIAVVDTNCNPDNIDYIIPGNDDAVKSIQFYAQTVADTILIARQNIKEEEFIEEKQAGGKNNKKPFNKPKKQVVVKGTKENNASKANTKEVKEEKEVAKQKTVTVASASVSDVQKEV